MLLVTGVGVGAEGRRWWGGGETEKYRQRETDTNRERHTHREIQTDRRMTEREKKTDSS